MTATNSSGSASADSSPTAVVALSVPVNTVAPSMSGNPSVGSQLTACPGSWTGNPVPPTFGYTWQRCDSSRR